MSAIDPDSPEHALREHRRPANAPVPSRIRISLARRMAQMLRRASRPALAVAGSLALFAAFIALLQAGLSLWQAATCAAIVLVLAQQTLLHVVGERNAALADRLEALEDRNWEIRESEELHRTVAETFGDIVIQRLPDGRVLHGNAVFESAFAGHLDALPAPEPAKGSRDIELQTANGKRWFVWRDLPARDTVSGAMGVRSVARDITERKNHEQQLAAAAEAAQAASEAKSRFLATMSHELRTPLNGILGAAQLLERTELDAAQRDHLDILDRSGRSLLALLEDLLDTARMEQGGLIIEPGPVDLAAELEAVAAMLAPRAAARNVPFATFTHARVPKTLQLDAERLRQVVLNLAGNAIKFTGSGGVAIRADCAAGALRLEVADCGPGIAEADRERIFQPFVQTDEGSTRSHNGAGLGLAIARHIVERMGGTLQVEDRPSGGCIFAITLPLPESAATPAVPESGKTIDLAVMRGPAYYALYDMLKAQGHAIAAPGQTADLHIADCTTNSMGSAHTCIRLSSLAPQDSAHPWLTWPIRRETLARVIDTAAEIEAPSIETPQAPSPSATPSSGIHVLLAEDEPVNAMIARSLLEGDGHRVTVVENGAQAVHEAQAGRFDMVLLDRHMPLMDGFDALAAIHARLPDLPVAIVSADASASAVVDARSRGAVAYMTKPVDAAALDRLLRRHATSCAAAV